jgi:hypothetical protein
MNRQRRKPGPSVGDESSRLERINALDVIILAGEPQGIPHDHSIITNAFSNAYYDNCTDSIALSGVGGLQK